MEPTQKFTEFGEVLATLAPSAANAAVGAHNAAWVDIKDFHRVFIWLQVGEAGAAGSTFDVDIYEAEDTDGTNAQQIADKSITQLTGADAGAYVGIEIQSEELDVDDDMHCLQARVTIGVNTYYFNLVVWGLCPRFEPVDVTGFDEVVE